MEDRIKAHLDRLRAYHSETYSHSLRVAEFSRNIASAERFSDNGIVLVGNSGLLHDIGKLQVPLGILSKEGELTNKERKIIKGHVRRGILVLEGDDFEEIRKVISYHHEFSRDPYPRNGRDRRDGNRDVERRDSDDLHIKLGQVLAVADLYDALSNERAYKKALNRTEVESILRRDFTGDLKYVNRVFSLN